MATNSVCKNTKKTPATRLSVLFLSWLVTCLLYIPSSFAGTAKHHKPWAEGRILVQPKSDISDAEMDRRLHMKGARLERRLARSLTRVVRVAPGSEEAMVAALSVDPQVAYAELDRLVSPDVMPANDPYFSAAWHLPKIGANSAWEQATGNGVVVAVLDTGVDGSHPDLQGRLVAGRNIHDNNTNTADVNNHGTWVAGTVAASTHNSLGVAAIAYNAKVMPIRISLPDGTAYLSTIASGIYWAADNGAHIANISYDGLTESPAIQTAANYMRSKNGLVVVAAGNSGTQRVISNSSAMITVSATHSGDGMAGFSSYGNYVDVSAPGQDIWTTSRGGGYTSVNGTSFASPATAAVLALMKSANPALSPTQLEQMLIATAVDLGSPGYDMYFGAGRINAAAAVAAAVASKANTPAPTPAPAPAPADTTPPLTNITSPAANATVMGTVTITANASDNKAVTRVEFLAGGRLIGTDTTAPYSLAWNSATVANGVTTLTVRAYDAAGNNRSHSVNISVQNLDRVAPSLSVQGIVNGGRISGTIAIKVTASDSGGLRQVTLSIDGRIIATANVTTTSTLMTVYWNTASATVGAHTIQARAIDKAGNASTQNFTVYR